MPIFFVEKMWEAFAVQKLLSFFRQKISVFGYKVVKDLTSWPLNELVKLTMLWTTGAQIGKCKIKLLRTWICMGTPDHHVFPPFLQREATSLSSSFLLSWTKKSFQNGVYCERNLILVEQILPYQSWPTIENVGKHKNGGIAQVEGAPVLQNLWYLLRYLQLCWRCIVNWLGSIMYLKMILQIVYLMQLFHAFAGNSQNYRPRCCGRPNALLPGAARPRAIVNRVVHITEGNNNDCCL